MKKFLIILAGAALLLLLTGCTAVPREEAEKESMFCLVEETVSWRVVYHLESKVMYAVSCGAYNSGNFTLLVNADGSPMLWEVAD